MQGKSLLPLCRGEVDKIRKFAIAGYYPYSWALYTEDWSYIHWNKANTNLSDMASFYGENVKTDELATDKSDAPKSLVRTFNQTDVKDEEKLGLGNNNTLDGAAQWSCTPSASSEVPAEDELYDRRNDQFQLNNVIKQHPDVAKKLFMQLKDYMEELKG